MNPSAMNMRRHWAENEAAMPEEYGDEVMLSGWNPQVAAVEQTLAVIDKCVAALEEMANADSDSFLQNMYERQC